MEVVEMTTENKINPFEHYKDELELINGGIAEIEELYAETKEHFDEVKNSRTKGSLSFVHLQTGNLISLKNAKFSMLKEMISIRKNIADLTMKQKAAEAGTDSKEKELLRQIAEMLDKSGSNPATSVEYEDVDETDVDSAIERQIAKLESQGKLEFTDNEKAAKYERTGGSPPELPSDEEEGEEEEEVQEKVKIIVVVKDKKWSFAAMNEVGRIVKGYPLPDKKQYKMKLTKDDGKLIAVDQDDRMYEVIKK